MSIGTTAPRQTSWEKDRRAVTPDGAQIAYTVVGTQGPVVALCAGLLCPDVWWSALVPALEAHGYRALVWHYRGIGASTLPAGGLASMSVPRLAADLRCVVEQEDLDSLAVLGHSMGAQVMLETWRQLHGRVVSLVAVTGLYASAIDTLYGRSDVARTVYEPARFVARLLPGPLRTSLWRTAWRRLPTAAIGRRLSVFGPRTGDHVFAAFAAAARDLDPGYVLAVLESMHGHSAEDLLTGVDVPTLVVAGDRDPFVPDAVSRRMAAEIPGAVLRVVPNGTHGSLLEYPELVNGWILDHLDRTLAS